MSDSEKAGADSAAREKIEELIEAVQPSAVDSAAEAVVEDAEFRRKLLMSFPDMYNAYAKMTEGMARSLEVLEPEQRAELVRDMAGRLDGRTLAEAANAFSRVLITLREENPELAEEFYPFVEEAVNSTDFGKVRVGLTASMEYTADMLIHFLDLSLENPVIIANMIGIVTPLVNNLIRVLSHAVSSVELPPEVLASAVFNVLLSIDASELGSTITSLAEIVNALHEGNLVLGRDEPRFRAVFDQFAEGLLENMDTEQLARAVVALGEDVEVVLESVTDLLHRDPQLLLLAGSTMGSLINVFIRGMSNFLLEFSQLPDEILFEMGEDMRQKTEAAEVARIINLYMLLYNRFLEVNPALYEDIAGTVVASIDLEQLGTMLKSGSVRLAGVAAKDPDISAALEPREIGRRVNESLRSFNAYMASRSGSASRFMGELFDSLDTGEVELALKNTVGAFTEVFFSSAGRVLAVLKPVATGLFKGLGRLLGGLLGGPQGR